MVTSREGDHGGRPRKRWLDDVDDDLKKARSAMMETPSPGQRWREGYYGVGQGPERALEP